MGQSIFYRLFISTNIYSLLIVYLSTVVIFFMLSLQHLSMMQAVLYFIAGVIIWSLVEYIVHRFLFHGDKRFTYMKKMQYFMHGYHHIKPRDSARLVLPFILTLPMAIGLYFLLFMLLPKYHEAILSGFLFGYICYDVSHYTIHCAQPLTRFGRFRRQYHFYHHFKKHSQCFGVTTPIWDVIFRTTKTE